MASPISVPISASITSVHSATQEKIPENDEEKLQSVRVYQDLTNYESKLNELTKSVDSFKPDISIVKELIECDKNLYQTLEGFGEYCKIKEELNNLSKEEEDINKKTREVLGILSDCYNTLNELPMLEQIEFERDEMLKQKAKLYSGEVLDYAMKLAKFTRFPPTFDKSAIGPNNFIWPAEDSLRRGMLALASLKSSELIGEDKKNEEPQEKNENEGDEKEQPKRKDSYEFSSNGKGKDDQGSDQQMDVDVDLDLDLDLFNPDEF